MDRDATASHGRPMPASTSGQNVLKSASSWSSPAQMVTFPVLENPPLSTPRSSSPPSPRSRVSSSSSSTFGADRWVRRYGAAAVMPPVIRARQARCEGSPGSVDLPHSRTGEEIRT